MLDPPDPGLDPVDMLISHTEDGRAYKPRPLDFVRTKMKELKTENKRLKERVADLEQTLSIVQTAQEWTMGNKMTPEQAEKMREIKALLEQAKKARDDIQKFSEASRQSLYEKLRACKNALRKEREEKREMKERLMYAFDHARALREQHRQLQQQRADEQGQWQDTVRDMVERHRRDLKRMQKDHSGSAGLDQQSQFSQFGEQVMGELTALEHNLDEARQETVNAVILEGDGDAPTGDVDLLVGGGDTVGGDTLGGGSGVGGGDDDFGAAGFSDDFEED